MSVHVYLKIKDPSKAQAFNKKFVEQFGEKEEEQP